MANLNSKRSIFRGRGPPSALPRASLNLTLRSPSSNLLVFVLLSALFATSTAAIGDCNTQLNFTQGALDPSPFSPACAQRKLFSFPDVSPEDFLQQHALSLPSKLPALTFGAGGTATSAYLDYESPGDARPSAKQGGTAYSFGFGTPKAIQLAASTSFPVWTLGLQKLGLTGEGER